MKFAGVFLFMRGLSGKPSEKVESSGLKNIPDIWEPTSNNADTV